MTYGELNKLSDKIASYLQAQGLKKEAFAAIRMGRCKKFIAAALGVHKAGGAYVPINLEYPAARVAYNSEEDVPHLYRQCH